MRRRAAALACGGLAAGALALLSTAITAEATSPARLFAATEVARQVGHHGLYGPAPDRAMVLGAWRDAGVDIRGLATPADLLHACLPLDVSSARPAGPAPGDYALYRDDGGGDRIGMFLSPVDVAIVDGGAVRVVMRPELSGDVGELTVARLLAQPGSFHACRLASVRWPGHVDDTSVGVGRIALADPEHIAEQLAWAAAHPRDADTSIGHTLARIFGAAVAGIVGTIEQLVGGIFSALHAILSALPWHLGAPFLFVGDLLGRRFDGRLLHRILTGVTVAVLGVLLLGAGSAFLFPLGWVIVGAVLGGAAASAAGVPVLGAVGGALVGAAFAVASFLTGVLTGIDGSDRDCVGTVLFALVCDALWLRPIAAAFGAAAHLERVQALSGGLARIERLPVLRLFGGDGRSALDVSSTMGDALALRPHAVAQVWHSVTTFGEVAAGDAGHLAARMGGAAVAPVHEAMSGGDVLTAMGRRGVDVLSLTYRPSSISSDLVGHAADALHFLDGEVRSGFPSAPRLRGIFDALSPERRQLVSDAAEHMSQHLVPQMQITARLSHLHSGARTMTALATGHPNNPRWLRAWRSPVLRRLPGSGGA